MSADMMPGQPGDTNPTAPVDPSERDQLLVMLLHGGAASNSIATWRVDRFAAEVRADHRAELLAEVGIEIRNEVLTEADADLVRLERSLRVEIDGHVKGKARWRARAEAAEKRLHDAAMAKVWTNEDGKKFVFVEDIAGPLLGIDKGADSPDGWPANGGHDSLCGYASGITGRCTCEGAQR